MTGKLAKPTTEKLCVLPPDLSEVAGAALVDL
jgi:hypothetical protein